MAEDEIYLPLGHDILVRRVLCWSYLGELDRALDETTKALEVPCKKKKVRRDFWTVLPQRLRKFSGIEMCINVRHFREYR